jgi:co-chaperonin GroES (HSP10)
MAEKKRKPDILIASADEDIEDQGDDDSNLPQKRYGSLPTETKRIRRLSPLGMRVLVGVRKDSSVSEGGLYLPEGAKNSTQESVLAEVIEVASAHDSRTDEETNVSGIPLGALVLIPKNAGVRVPWNESLRIVDTKDILAIVSEMTVV